jgi:hypothetical protein
VFCGVFVRERSCAWARLVWVSVRACVVVVCVCVVCVSCACVRVVWYGVVCVFFKMKEHLAGKRHAADALQHAVAVRLNRLAADRYDMGISKLVSRYDKCLNVESDYVETLVKVCATTCMFVFFPFINTYFLIAKRSLLSGYPSYINSINF